MIIQDYLLHYTNHSTLPGFNLFKCEVILYVKKCILFLVWLFWASYSVFLFLVLYCKALHYWKTLLHKLVGLWASHLVSKPSRKSSDYEIWVFFQVTNHSCTSFGIPSRFGTLFLRWDFRIELGVQALISSVPYMFHYSFMVFYCFCVQPHLH